MPSSRRRRLPTNGSKHRFAATITSPQSTIGGQPLEVAPRRLPRLLGEEPVTGRLGRELPVVVLEVHPVEDERLRRALLHRRLQRDARRDRVRQAAARRGRRGEPQAVLDERRHLQVAAQELDPLGPEVLEDALVGARCGSRPRSGSRPPCPAGSRGAPTAGPGRGTRTSRSTSAPSSRRPRSPRPSSKYIGQPRSQVAVHRRLGVDRDVLVERRAALARRVPAELALGLVAGRLGRAVADPLDRRRSLGRAAAAAGPCSPPASADVVNLSWKIRCSETLCLPVSMLLRGVDHRRRAAHVALEVECRSRRPPGTRRRRRGRTSRRRRRTARSRSGSP